jgi:hypothetical protein
MGTRHEQPQLGMGPAGQFLEPGFILEYSVQSKATIRLSPIPSYVPQQFPIWS